MTNRHTTLLVPQNYFTVIMRNDGTIVICQTEDDYIAFLAKEREDF